MGQTFLETKGLPLSESPKLEQENEDMVARTLTKRDLET